MEYEDIFAKITDWAKEHQINQANPRVEFMKIAEELGELSSAYNKENREKLIDSIGDLQIALYIFCGLVDVNHKEAVLHAFKEIEHRTGKTTEDGVFIKQSDLREN